MNASQQERDMDLDRLKMTILSMSDELKDIYLLTGKSRIKVTDYLLDRHQFVLGRGRVADAIYQHMVHIGVAKMGKKRDNIDQSRTCLCGAHFKDFGSYGSHAKSCMVFQSEVTRVKDNIKGYLVEYYRSVLSVAACIGYVAEQEQTPLEPGRLRIIITQYLKSVDEFRTFGDEDFEKSRQSKLKKTTKERYGVENIGMLPGKGRSASNHHPITTLSIMDDLKRYREEVEKLTKSHVGLLQKLQKIPARCYYTDIVFNDIKLRGKVNNQDPFKRSVDHLTPVSEAFILGWSPEQAAHPENLRFCLRMINTIKGNSSEERFRELLLPLLKEKLKDYIDESESCQANT